MLINLNLIIMRKIYSLILMLTVLITVGVAQNKKVMVIYDVARYEYNPEGTREDSALATDYVRHIETLVNNMDGYEAELVDIKGAFENEEMTIEEMKEYAGAIVTPSLSSSQAAYFGEVGDSIIPVVNLCAYAIRLSKSHWLLLDHTVDGAWMADKAIIDSLKPTECTEIEVAVSHPIFTETGWNVGDKFSFSNEDAEVSTDNAHIQTFTINQEPWASNFTVLGNSTYAAIPSGNPKSILLSIDETERSKRMVHMGVHFLYPANADMDKLLTASLKWVVDDLTIGVTDKNIANFELNCYPNPATSKINVDFIANGDAKVTLSNTLGQIVYQNVSASNLTIDISDFNTGMYFVQVNVNGKTQTQQLVVE